MKWKDEYNACQEKTEQAEYKKRICTENVSLVTVINDVINHMFMDNSEQSIKSHWPKVLISIAFVFKTV